MFCSFLASQLAECRIKNHIVELCFKESFFWLPINWIYTCFAQVMLLHNVLRQAQDKLSAPSSPLATHQQSLPLSMYSFKCCLAFCITAVKILPSIAILSTKYPPKCFLLALQEFSSAVLSFPATLIHIFAAKGIYLCCHLSSPVTLSCILYSTKYKVFFFCFRAAFYLNPHFSVIWY